MDLRYFFACSSFILKFQEMRGMNIPMDEARLRDGDGIDPLSS